MRRGDVKPDAETIGFATNLAAFYSDARTERKAVVSLAQPRHVKKPRGAPVGTVALREELRSVLGYPQDVPDELKERKMESGFGWSDDMGGRSKKKKKPAKSKEKDKPSRQDKQKYQGMDMYDDP